MAKFFGHEHLCTCLVRQGAPGASAVRHREAGKCAKTEIYDLSILMKEDGVLGFWGNEWSMGHFLLSLIAALDKF